jgi:hypothetical protein
VWLEDGGRWLPVRLLFRLPYDPFTCSAREAIT